MTGSCARNLATWAMGTWLGKSGGYGEEKVIFSSPAGRGAS